MSSRCLAIWWVVVLLLLPVSSWVSAESNAYYECDGDFRPGFECFKAVDGDTMTSAVPNAYGDSVFVIEEYIIPPGISGAIWQFRVLRNSPQIEVTAYYWNYSTNEWDTLYDAPQDNDYRTYRVPIPGNGLLYSPLKTRVKVRNATMPQQSGEYFDGAVDWIYPSPDSSPYYSCEGVFRAGHECWMAVDGDTMTSAVPDLYGDSIAVIEYHDVPSGVSAANWRFRVLRNTEDIAIRAYYWNYQTEEWALLYDVPLDLDYRTYTMGIPVDAFLNSPLKTKMYVKNASSPLMSGEYFEGVIDWIYPDQSPAYECEGQFRPGNECRNAVDGNWWSGPDGAGGACPELYGDSVAVVEYYPIPQGINGAKWYFKVLRNAPQIKVTAYCWDYGTSEWVAIYDVPIISGDTAVFMKDIPANLLLHTPLKTKMYVKNATSPAQSGYYFEADIDWTYPAPEPSPYYSCEGVFRPGFECWKAVDGDTATSAVPDAYGDSVYVIEDHVIPPGVNGAIWQFRVLRNAPQIEVTAYYWNYDTDEWDTLYDVPLDESGAYHTYRVSVPAAGVLSSPLKTKMKVKNATMPQQSGEYFDGLVDWTYACCDLAGDANYDGKVNVGDAVFIVNYVFRGGPPPVCLSMADPNGDCAINIGDAVYLVNFIFRQGLAPICGCVTVPAACCQNNGAPEMAYKPASAVVSTIYDGDATKLIIQASDDIYGLQFEVKGVNGAEIVNQVDQTQLYHQWTNGSATIGIMDINGIGRIPAGETAVLTIAGEANVLSALGADIHGRTFDITIGEAAKTEALPSQFALHQNRPNPFNPTTEIAFTLPKAAEVTLEVYNITGQKIATLVNGHLAAGYHTTIWNGKDDSGRGVSSGIYLYRIKADEYTETRKMVLLK